MQDVAQEENRDEASVWRWRGGGVGGRVKLHHHCTSKVWGAEQQAGDKSRILDRPRRKTVISVVVFKVLLD